MKTYFVDRLRTKSYANKDGEKMVIEETNRKFRLYFSNRDLINIYYKMYYW